VTPPLTHESNGNGNGHTDQAALTLTKADFQSAAETRWCPGCGDYAILAAMQGFLPEIGIPPERIVFVSGIGCAGRFSYYMNTYGMHGIHGRAPALATGLAATRPDLSIWVVSGDGDALSIGGNHLIHALRRNVPIKILLFNNQIYGLTKGQASPTSERGKVTKSTPFGSEDGPFNPVSLALGAEASFVARTIDRDKQHLPAMLRAAAAHPGAALVEIYQNCPVFNDGAFAAFTDKQERESHVLALEHGQPLRFGADREWGIARGADGDLHVVRVDAVGEDALLVHDAHREDPSLAFALSRIGALDEADSGGDGHPGLAQGPLAPPTPIGIFRDVERPVWGRELADELAVARDRVGTRELDGLLRSADTWTVA
jgi:2-oxoglutarate ferredoxin oxidoreductase subunit beta